MTSRLYECQVTHARFIPRRHRFSYRIFMLAADLDELPALDRKLRLFGFNRRGVYSLREADYLPVAAPAHNSTAHNAHPTADSLPPRPPAVSSLKARALALLAARGIALPATTRVELVTLPRILGYLFNPVSFYFFRDESGANLAAIAEVTNTFREVKPYVLGPDSLLVAQRENTSPAAAGEPPLFRLRVPKHFYVSPFSDVDVAFDFRLRPPGEKLSVRIDDYAGSERTLASVLVGAAAPLTDRRLAWFSLKYPLLTLRVIALIHWHALRLYLKKLPWFPKAARPADQRDLYRPHASLSPRPASPSAP
jgi:DUF1365 family protein